MESVNRMRCTNPFASPQSSECLEKMSSYCSTSRLLQLRLAWHESMSRSLKPRLDNLFLKSASVVGGLLMPLAGCQDLPLQYKGTHQQPLRFRVIDSDERLVIFISTHRSPHIGGMTRPTKTSLGLDLEEQGSAMFVLPGKTGTWLGSLPHTRCS